MPHKLLSERFVEMFLCRYFIRGVLFIFSSLMVVSSHGKFFVTSQQIIKALILESSFPFSCSNNELGIQKHNLCFQGCCLLVDFFCVHLTTITCSTQGLLFAASSTVTFIISSHSHFFTFFFYVHLGHMLLDFLMISICLSFFIYCHLIPCFCSFSTFSFKVNMFFSTAHWFFSTC